MLDPSGGGVPPPGDPRVAAVMQMLQAAALQRQQGAQVPAPFTAPLQYPDNPAELASGGGVDMPQFLGPPPVQPDPRFLGPPEQQLGGGGPTFGGGPVYQGGMGPGFDGGPIDKHAAARHHGRNAPKPMDPQRALAIQEMGKYLQAWGKLHQQHGALHDAMSGGVRNP
jgi:hypothetical protein